MSEIISLRHEFLLVLTCCCLMALVGCGGGSPTEAGNEKPSDYHQLQGQVDLPDGSTVDSATITLVCGSGTAPVASDGGFEIPLFNDSGQLVVATSAEGHPLLMARLGGDADQLDVRGTAEALTWFALGAWLMPADAGRHIHELIAELDTELADLEAAIAAEIVIHPEGFDGFNQAIHDALSATVAALTEGGRGAAEKGVLVEPDGQRSGVLLLNRGGVNSIVLRNTYRRRVWTSIDRIAWVDQDDDEHELEEAATILELEPTGAFDGVFGTIASYFTGDIAYTPTETDPIALETYPDAKYALYTVVTGGMGVVAPDAEDALSEFEMDSVKWVALKTVVWDLFVPLILNVMATLDHADRLDGMLGLEDWESGDLLTLIDFTKDTVPEVYNSAVEGNATEAMYALWDAVSNTGQYQDAMFDFVRDLVISMGADAPAAGLAAKEAAAFFKTVELVDLVGGYMDTFIVGWGIGHSEVADRWSIKVSEAKVSIDPLIAGVPWGARLDTLRVNVVDDTGIPDGSSYAYRWRCTGDHGWIENPRNTTDMSNDFTTSSDWISYVAFLNTTGIDSVYVSVYRSLWGVQELVGETVRAVSVVEDLDVRVILRGSDTTDFDITQGMWWHYDTEGYINTYGAYVYPILNGTTWPSSHLSGINESAHPQIIIDAKLGDHLRLEINSTASGMPFGPCWIHIVGLETPHHTVHLLTEETPLYADTYFVYELILD